MRRLSLIAVALAVLVAAAPADAANRRQAVKKRQLTAFQSCEGLINFAEKRTRRFGTDVFDPRRPVAISVTGSPPQPVPGREQQAAQGGPTADSAPAAPQPVEGTDFSGTNVQERGVDEPDAVKTDGRRLYVAQNQKLYKFDLTGDAPRLDATITLEGYGHELLLSGDKLLVLSSEAFTGPYPVDNVGGPRPAGAPASDVAPSISPVPYRPTAKLLELDADDLSLTRTLEVPGNIVGGRLRGSTARIAISTQTGILPTEDLPMRLREWVPALEVTRQRDGRALRRSIAPCTSIRRPEVFAGLGLLTVLTIDLDTGLFPVDSDAIMADASTVYASANRMYFATEKWLDPTVLAEGVAPGRSTTIHAFDVKDADRTAYVGSGSVRGYLLNQFSLSEHKGFLRVATTDDPPWLPNGPVGESESFVSVLDERAGGLAEVGRVGGLGKGERIYAVRFMEDTGFVVTFRQVDPLYTLDLGTPAAPRVVGELKIPGFSSYLHPIADGLVIGVGQDATDGGRVQGSQVSLFDVSDLANPTRLHQFRFGQYSSTQAEYDHHAFLWWAATKLLVLPLIDYDERSNESFAGASGLHVERSGITEIARFQHPEQEGYTYPISRALVVGDRLLTIGAFGIRSGRLDTLAETSFTPFAG